MITPANHVCLQEGCPFNKTGECLEDLPLDDCTHLEELLKEAESPEVDENLVTLEPLNSTPINETIAVYPSFAFEQQDADDLAAQKECTLVVIAGDVDSGKTTLVGRCFAQFFTGPASGWRFAGSQTLLGFDERIHNHRLGSRQAKAVTPHTPRDVEHYYHLDLCSEDGTQKRTLLIHDISGENYQDAISHKSGAEALIMVRRADVVSMLINGEGLLRAAPRANASSRLIDIIRALAEVDYLRHAPPVDLVVSRWDYVVNAGQIDEINTFLQEFQGRVEQLLKDYKVSSAISVNRVASVTHFGDTEAGFGFGDLFESWTTVRPKPAPTIYETLSAGGRGEGWTEVGRHREETHE